MKRYIYIFILLTSICGQSQNIFQGNDYIDYIITLKNDTIYGSVHNTFIKTKGKRVTTKKFDYFNFQKTNLKNAKMYFRNDVLYLNKDFFREYNWVIKQSRKNIYTIFNKYNFIKPVLLDSLIINEIDGFISVSKRKLDYLIRNNDTIFGTLNSYEFTDNDLFEKYINQIKFQDVTEYRYNNQVYKKAKVSNLIAFNDKELFCESMCEGKLELFRVRQYIMNRYEQPQIDSHFFIRKKGDTEFKYILQSRFDKILYDFISDNPELLEKIKLKIYTYNDLYLIVKYYNLKS